MQINSTYSNVLENIRIRTSRSARENMNTRKLEKIVRGFANHRRIQIMGLLGKDPDLSVAEISEELDVDFRTISEHLRRLHNAGLVLKRNVGSEVEHVLSSTGKSILMFLRTLE